MTTQDRIVKNKMSLIELAEYLQNAQRKQQHTAKRVYDRLKELYPDEFTADEQ